MAAAARTVLLVLLTAGCAARAAESAGSTPVAAAAPVRSDVRFMQDMIVHHAQALELTALVPARSERPDMHRLAERIEVAQADEMALMRRWLAARGAAAPAAHAHGAHDAAMPGMPGMLTAEEIAALAQLRGSAFERGFLESMIRHHEGALEMVAALTATGGANADAELFHFVSGVDADQRAEIARMRTLLNSFPQ